MTYWFTSDLHIGHQNIINYQNRPFADVQEMNEMLIHYWNELVNPDDVVYVIGDWAMGKIVDSLALTPRFNGIKILVPGNHDRCWYGGKKDFRDWAQRYIEAGFAYIYDTNTAPFTDPETGMRITLCHFPRVMVPRHDDKFKAYSPDEDGNWLIHGHVHGGPEEAINFEHKTIDVGMDAWDYHPISLDGLRPTLLATEQQANQQTGL